MRLWCWLWLVSEGRMLASAGAGGGGAGPRVLLHPGPTGLPPLVLNQSVLSPGATHIALTVTTTRDMDSCREIQ